MVMDQVSPEGNLERINTPSATLHDSGIQDNATLQASPESVAALNPQIRQMALARARLEMIEFSKGRPDVKMEANNPTRPTQYILSFTANGWAPPALRNLPPPTQLEHRVYIFLDSEFPLVAPQVRWLTPFFHPNVDLREGRVCLGELKDKYQPGLDLGKLCLIILDIANYRNYQVSSYLNESAALWAESEEGQKEIGDKGGRVLQKDAPAGAAGSLKTRLRIEKI